MKTQNQEILEYLTEFGSITPLDAIREFGCMRLASRICDLKKMGYDIHRDMESNINRKGRKVAYARYRMEKVR